MALSLAANINPKCDLKDLLEWANIQQALQHYAIEFQDINGNRGAKHLRGDILNKQWKFLAPSFSPSVLHQEFKDDLILPFIKNDHIGGGHFGDVYRIEVHRDYLPHHSSEDIPLPSLILADFGLSRLKRRGESSSTLSKRGQDDYVAPECQDWENDLQMGRIHRSAELWSFGCILTEILAFMHGGSARVNQFRAERGAPTTIPGLTTTTAFYCGGKQISPHVNICDHIMRIGDRNDSLGVTLERLRFDGWRYATGLLPKNEGLAYQQQQSYHHDFDRTKNLLIDLRAQIEEQEGSAQLRLQISGMSLVIDLLHEILLPQERDLAEYYFDDQLYGHKAMDTYDRSDARLDSKHKLRLKLREMTKCLDMDRLDDSPSTLKLNAKTIQLEGSFEDHSLGFLDGENALKTRIFIEWRQIKGVSADPANTGGDKLSRHTYRLARLLNTEEPEGLLVLHCRGYFVGKRRATGPLTPALAFDFPPGMLQPTTLHTVMSKCKSLADHPVLEDKFKLAHSLAMTVYEFQRLGWVHKRLSPSNIVFFVDEKRKSAAAQDLVQQTLRCGVQSQ
ncbi:hypothetical protein F5883DRAFT_516440 [Diaporthe sp. PMI_573]|nr:hypothetical protein F5883DRAFT_516440 [Diaporthaceae sp. PMI_573]